MSTNTDIDVARLQVGLRHVEKQIEDLVKIQRDVSLALTKLSALHEEMAEMRTELEAVRIRINKLEVGKPVNDLASGWIFKGALALIALLLALLGSFVKINLGVM